MKKIISDYLADIHLITRNVKLFLLGGLLIGVLFAFMQLLLNLYFKDIGLGEGFIGKVLSFFALGGLVAAIPSAYLIARYRLKPFLIAAAVLLSGTFIILVTSPWKGIIFTAAFSCGLMITYIRVAAGPFIMRNSGEQERTLLFSLNFGSNMLAGIFGSISGGALQKLLYKATGDVALSYQYALVIAGAIGLLAVIPYLLIKGKPPAPDEVARAFSIKSLRRKWKLFLKLTFPFFLLGAGAGLIIPFMNLYFRNRFDLQPAKIGVYFSLLQVTMLIGILSGPILRRRFGFIRTVVSTELLSIPFMLILCYTDNLHIALGAFLLRGVLMNMAQPVYKTFAMEAVNEEDHGLINSLSSIAWAASWGISTQFGGQIIEAHGFVPSFLLAIGLYLASAFTYYYYFSNCEKSESDKTAFDLTRMR